MAKKKEQEVPQVVVELNVFKNAHRSPRVPWSIERFLSSDFREHMQKLERTIQPVDKK